MTSDKFQIETMSRRQVDLAIDWAAAEGWNPGLEDADCFYAADQSGFLIGTLEDRPIACISVVKYGAQFGFLGFYIVHPDFRGQGYGLRIWQAGLEYLQGRTVGLDGVVAQQDNYRKSGFELAYRNIRYVGTGGQPASEDAAIVPLASRPIEEVIGYDQAFFPDARRDFLRCWISRPRSTALGILHNSILAGYTVIRPCREGYKIGPLFADSAELAERLFLAVRARVEKAAPIYLDTPEVNSAAVDLAERQEMKMVFETARMYKGGVPSLPNDRSFGVTTFELG